MPVVKFFFLRKCYEMYRDNGLYSLLINEFVVVAVVIQLTDLIQMSPTVLLVLRSKKFSGLRPNPGSSLHFTYVS